MHLIKSQSLLYQGSVLTCVGRKDMHLVNVSIPSLSGLRSNVCHRWGTRGGGGSQSLLYQGSVLTSGALQCAICRVSQSLLYQGSVLTELRSKFG